MVNWHYLLLGLAMTAQLWLGAFALSIVLALPIAAMRRSSVRALQALGAVWMGAARGVPNIVLVILLFYGGFLQGNATLAVIVALALINSSYVASSIMAGFNAVPVGQTEAANALAIPRVLTIVRVVLPQAMPIIVAGVTTYAITLLKATALASILGVNEMMYYANGQVQMGGNAILIFAAAGALYLMLTIPLGALARWLDSRSVIAKVR